MAALIKEQDVNTESNVASFSLNPDELRRISKENRESVSDEIIENVYQHIISGATSKINYAAHKSFESTNLCKFSQNGSNQRLDDLFRDINTSNIIFKSKLLSKLRTYFNPTNDKNGFYVGMKNFPESNDYVIFISWKNKSLNHDNHQRNSNSNNGSNSNSNNGNNSNSSNNSDDSNQTDEDNSSNNDNSNRDQTVKRKVKKQGS